jgi:hypothetical protein
LRRSRERSAAARDFDPLYRVDSESQVLRERRSGG